MPRLKSPSCIEMAFATRALRYVLWILMLLTTVTWLPMLPLR